MSIVITVNIIDNFPQRNIVQAVVAAETVIIEGERTEAETRIYSTDSSIPDFDKYIITHSQKYQIEGKIWGREFREILRRFQISVYIKNNFNYALTIGSVKGTFAQSAFRRLSKETTIRCNPLDVDLIEAIENITAARADIYINSGWFSNLGLPNLQNVLLQGDDVNRSPDWERFKRTHGASLSNIELIVEDEDFPTGQVKISLSKRGFLYSKRNMSDAKCLEIAERIINAIYPDSRG